MDSGKVVLGALIGLAAGAVLGVLFAPERGCDLRRKVATKSGDYLGELKTKYNHVIDSLTSKLDHASSEGGNLNDDAWETAEKSASPFSHS